MKYLGMLVALLMTFSSMMAQEMSLGKAINALNLKSKDFTPLMGPVKNDSPGVYTSLIKVQGAKDSYFEKGKATLFGDKSDALGFRSNFGDFNSMAELNAYVQKIGKQVKSDYPLIRFAQSNVDEKVDTWNYWILWEAKDRFNRLACYLEANKKGDTYNLSFVYPLVQKGTMYKEYSYIQNEADTSSYSSIIVELLGEATQDFSGIKGEKIDSLESTYKADRLSIAFANSYIVDKGPEHAKFHLPVNKDLDLNAMKQEAGNAFTWLTGALGKNYAYTISSDGLDVTFVHKQFPAVPLCVIDVINNKKSFSVEVVFYSNRLSSFLFVE